jgi:hypothetical protein
MDRATSTIPEPTEATIDGAHVVVPSCRRRRLAIQPVIERAYEPDRDAMVAALRVVLGLPRRLRSGRDWRPT